MTHPWAHAAATSTAASVFVPLSATHAANSAPDGEGFNMIASVPSFLKRGIEDARQGRISYLGSFAQYAAVRRSPK